MKQCVICGKGFQHSRYHPYQKCCNNPECKHEMKLIRNCEYMKKKLENSEERKKHNEYRKRWGNNNPEKISAYNKSDKKRESSKVYNQSLKGKLVNQLCSKHTKHNFSRERWFSKLYKTNGFCPNCDKWFGIDNLTIDHNPPRSKMPKDYEYSINEVQPLCMECNLKKGDKIW